MSSFFDPRSVTGRNLNDDQILQILGDGNLSEIEDFHEDDDDFAPNVMGDLNDLFCGMEPEQEPELDPERYVDVSAPNVVERYNQHMGGVDVLDQQMEYYRTFIKTKKWTLKVLIHFLDLAIVNSWRLYRNDCQANNLTRKDILPLLDFRLNIADGLSSTPSRERRMSSDTEYNPPMENENPIRRRYRPADKPSDANRYDGYDHFPVFDEIKAPRMCRHESCGSRTKIRCEKCDTNLCIARGKDCFKSYHQKK